MIKYRDPYTGNFKDVAFKTRDTVPEGAEVDYNGETVPTGWEEVPSYEHIYSTSEVKTNKKWIDGKPIYRKTFTDTYPSSSTTASVAHSIANISKVWIDMSHSYFVYTDGTSFPVTVVVPAGSSSRTPVYGVQTSVDETNINFRNIFESSSNRAESYVITLFYTKTTD